MTKPSRKTNPAICAPINRCIYCGATDCDLSKEHIIPYALDGESYLPKASCKSCANITHRFELTCARSVFGNFRMRHKVQTRHKNERPDLIAVRVLQPDGNEREVLIPPEEYPNQQFYYIYREAGLLRGIPSNLVSPEWRVGSAASMNDLVAFEKKHGGKFAFVQRFYPVEFARLIAKIGYCYAVGTLGLGAFTPLVVDLILGRTEHFAPLIGSTWGFLGPLQIAATHTLSFGGRTINDRTFIIVNVRLFAITNSPSYHVVVGEVESPEQYDSLMKDVFNDEAIEAALATAKPAPVGKFITGIKELHDLKKPPG